MNKAKLLEQLQALKDSKPQFGNDFSADAVQECIELVEQLTCTTDPTFPAVIKEPVPIRDYGVLYLVKDASNDKYHITRQDELLHSFWNVNNALMIWDKTVSKYYPETRETK